MTSDAAKKFSTGAAKFGEHWELEEDEAVLHLLLTSKGRRDVEGMGALAEALERTVDAIDWRLDSIASQLEGFRGPKEQPLKVSAQLDALLRSFERDPERVKEQARASYQNVLEGQRPAALRAARQRSRQDAKTCQTCFQERALDGSCAC